MPTRPPSNSTWLAWKSPWIACSAVGASRRWVASRRARGRDGRRVVLGRTDFQHERAVGAEEAADVPALGLVGESPDRAGPEVGTAGQEVAQQSPARVRLEQVAERAELGVLGEERDRD